MAKKNMFERAAKKKLRFEYNGMISAEDLWELGLEQLDGIYKGLSAKKRETSEDSLLEAKSTKENSDLNLRIEIIRHIVEAKLDEKNARETAAKRKAHKEKIMEIMAKKQDAELEEKSLADLQKELDQL